MRIKILLSAVNDLQAGADFYERQREGLGTYFLDSLFSDTDSLVQNAGIHSIVFAHHRLLSKKFPYAVYYTVDRDLAVVRRVLDLRRNPGSTRAALE